MAYTIAGNKLLENGKEIQLFGVNLTGMELKDGIVGGLWSGITLDNLLDNVKAMGFNCVRLPITSSTIANVAVDQGIAGTWNVGNAILKDKKSLEACDILIEGLEKRGIHYFFDLHYLDANGRIPDLWYTDAYPEVQWLSDLSKLSGRYKGKPGFIGIDIKNEPNSNTATWGDGNSKTDWKMACEKAFLAINAANPDIIIIVEWLGTNPGLSQMRAKPLLISADKLALSVHLYGPDVWKDFGDGFKDAAFPINMPAIWERMFGNVASTQYVIVGEFGGNYGKGSGGDKDKTWQDAFVKYLISKGNMSFTYWQMGPNSGDTGGMLQDDWKTPRTEKINMLASLRSSRATFTGAAINSPVTADVTPSAPPTPLPSRAFKAGDLVMLKTLQGPKMLVLGYDGRKLQVVFWNPVVGDVEYVSFPDDTPFRI